MVILVVAGHRHVLQPKHDLSRRMLRECPLRRYGVVMPAAFLALGTATTATAPAPALGGTGWPRLVGRVVVEVGPLGAAGLVDTRPDNHCR